MEVEDYEMLLRYFRKHPPTHLLVQAFIGTGDDAEATKKDDRLTWENESIESLLSRWNGPGTSMSKVPIRKSFAEKYGGQ